MSERDAFIAGWQAYRFSPHLSLDTVWGIYARGSASAIEARSDATPKSDAAEGESAALKGDAQ